MLAHISRFAMPLALLMAFPAMTLAYSPNTDLTAAGAIAALKIDPDASHSYSETYNLGATGLRGWIYMDANNGDSGSHGLLTGVSRQILVTVAEAPGNGVMAVDDVILGAMAASSGEVPLFTSDCRKTLGVVIGNAEKTGAGTLRVKRWRGPYPGTLTDVNIPMTIMGDYAATAPFSCPKSAQILANARTKMVSQLLADPYFLSTNYGGAIDALALLAAVVPGDSDYAAVQNRLQSYAQALTPANLSLSGCDTWNWSYITIFLSEYYLRTVADGAPNAGVLAGINKYTVAMASAQSRYGTFGHGGSALKTDGSLHGTIPPYGPVNSAGIPANIGIVMGKKALLAGSHAIHPEIDPAIERGSKFFAYYVNKGSIPYGEHEPWISGHGSNGKDSMCAVLFGLQENRPVEAEFFARMSIAGCTGREYGHTGQGFSYLWGSIGSNMGGPTASAKYMENIRWQLDLARRTDGSFSYGGKEQFGGGNTANGTYLGNTGYYDLNPTATYLLSYGVALQRLYLTGRNAIPANTLNAAKVTHAIGAATFKQDSVAYTHSQLIAVLGDYDPIVRNEAALQLGARSLSTAEVNTLLAMAAGSNANERMGSCQTLGRLRTPAALTLLSQRLSDPDLWVRALAAKALGNYGTAATPQLTPMLTAFVANATDPEVIVWDDPVQIANGFLASTVTNSPLASATASVPKSLLYPVIRVGLAQPDSLPRTIFSFFTRNSIPLADVKALTPEFLAVATTTAQADSMWHADARASGISNLADFKAAEAIPIALSMQYQEPYFGWGSPTYHIAALNALASFGDSARWTLPTLRNLILHKNPNDEEYPAMFNAIASIENAITSPAGIINLVAIANSQVVVTTGAKAITLTGSSCRGTPVTFTNVTSPIHGTLTGTAPNLIYTPTAGYTGPDHFTFRAVDTLTTSETGTVSLIVGTAGIGLKGEYFDNTNFTNLKLTRTDPQVNFDWGTASPAGSVGADTFSVRWSGQLLVPETGTYTFSTLNSDGARLYINGISLLDDYIDQTTSWKDSLSISLTAGQMVELQMEYYENTGSAVAKLKWTGPSFAGRNGSVIAKEWLYDGTGVINRLPYAHAQSLSMIQNTDQAIALTGSGSNQTPLTYSIVTQPGHGTLTGTAPNLIYSPTVNYNGADSFTFLVNNGTSNSAPATISISISAGQPQAYFWSQAVTGNWSGSFWTDAASRPVTPAATGGASYTLNFNQAGTYTTTQDLNHNFAFNQLNLAGAVTIDGTKSLSPTANGPLLPQINQNSNSFVTLRAPLNLVAMTTLGGIGNGQVDFPLLISGSGGLIKNGAATVKLFGESPNTYSGGTIVNGGTLHLGTIINGSSVNCINPVGTGAVTLNSGGRIQFDRVAASNALIVNGGTLYTPNGWGASWSGGITLNGTATVDAPYTFFCSGAIGGAGGFNKTGDGTLLLTGSNNSTGNNSITVGTLQCNSAAALGSGAIHITSGAKVNLNFTGTRAIAALSYNGGAALPPGTYGSVASPATNKNDTYFSGNGTITILPASATVLALTSGSTPSNLDAPLTFTATVTGSSPTGNVAFYDGTTLLATSALNGSFQTTFTTSSLSIGVHPITAKYAGNPTHAASSSGAMAIEITSLLAAPPTNLLAVRGNHTVGLTWTVSAGAISYKVKRALSSGGPYTMIGNSSVARYDDLTVNNSTTYYYVVSAVNGVGESINSAAAVARLGFLGLPVTSGLVLRMDASQITGTTDGAQLDTWADTSGADNQAVRQSGSSSGYPKYVASGINGRPVVRFNSANANTGDYFKFNRISTIRTVFWVLKENAGLSDGHFLLGDSDNNTYDFHRASPNGPLWDTGYASSNIKTGTTKLMGNAVNGTTTSLPSASFQLVSLTTAGNVTANQICQDRIWHGSWQGDIAEILIYDRPLTDDEENQVGYYLGNKYGLTTGYSALPVANGLVLRMDASQITGTTDGAQLDTWADTSGADNDAVRQSGSSPGYPKYVASGINNLPVVRFNSANPNTGDYLRFNRISTIRSVFWVLKENAGLSDGHFLLGDSDSATYHFHRGSANGPLWDTAFASPKIMTGITKLMGNAVNGTTTSLPSVGFQLVSLMTTGDVTANQICQDRFSHGSWQGDIAEILIYNRALTAPEETAVGSYLAAKYGLNTNYPIRELPPPVVPTPTTTRLLSSLSPAAPGVNVTFTASVTGGSPSGNVTFFDGATALGTSLLNGSFQATFTHSSLAVGTHTITAQYAGNSLHAASTSPPLIQMITTPYAAWADGGAQGLSAGVNDDPADDPDHDGFSNLMEFALGGSPMLSSHAIQPTLTKPADSWQFEYDRSDAAQSTTTHVVEYGSNLTGWTPVIIPAASAGTVEITPGSPSDRVKVTIPNQGSQTFVRLKVSK